MSSSRLQTGTRSRNESHLSLNATGKPINSQIETRNRQPHLPMRHERGRRRYSEVGLFAVGGYPPGIQTSDPVGSTVTFTPTQYFGFYYADESDPETLNGPEDGCWALAGCDRLRCTPRPLTGSLLIRRSLIRALCSRGGGSRQRVLCRKVAGGVASEMGMLQQIGSIRIAVLR